MKLLSKKEVAKKDTKVEAQPAAASEHQMLRLNLLPWRETLRKEREARFGIVTAACVAITGAAFFAVHMYFAALIEFQDERNNYLKAEIKKAEKMIKEIEDLEKEKEKLFQRMKIIQELQSSRPNVVHLVDELVTTLPEGVYYTNMKQTGGAISLKGFAKANAYVATLMRNLGSKKDIKLPKDEKDAEIKSQEREAEQKASQWFKNPSLGLIQRVKQNNIPVSQFELSVQQDSPKKEKSEEGEGGK